jgi:hypothetical protein
MPRLDANPPGFGDFQEFMGQARANQLEAGARGAASAARPALPDKVNRSDQSDPADRSDRSDRTAPATRSAVPAQSAATMAPATAFDPASAGLFAVLFAQPPNENIPLPKTGGSLQHVPPADTEPVSSQPANTASPNDLPAAQGQCAPVPPPSPATAPTTGADKVADKPAISTPVNNSPAIPAKTAGFNALSAIFPANSAPDSSSPDTRLDASLPSAASTPTTASEDGRLGEASLPSPVAASTPMTAPQDERLGEASLPSPMVAPAAMTAPQDERLSQASLPTPTVASAPINAPVGADSAAARDIAPLLAPPVPQSGTPVANSSQHMKFATQRNEIAGSAEQKLPLDAQTAHTPAGGKETMPVARIRIPADFSDPNESATQWMVLHAKAGAEAAGTLTTNIANASAPLSGRIEQVERLIDQEIVLVRQSGAASLAVSLKVDSKTSLFLQLTTHQGHIEASVRCEAGDAGALGEHWGQLQESLARQNVHLLPLDDAAVSSNTPFEPASESGKNFQGGTGPQNEPPRPPAPEVEKSSDDALDAVVEITKPRNKSRHYHGWEKWA